MTRSIALVAFVLAVPCVSTAADERRITNASNVRLRSAPATTASIVTECPLGTELVAVAHTSGTEPWYHVKTDDGRDGWVLGSLTTSIDPDHKEKTLESIIKARLDGGGSFSASVQLFDLIERTSAGSTDREAQGRFALYRLRSINSVFSAVPFSVRDRDVDVQRPGAEPYSAWIRAHRDAARYNEPGGNWMVDPHYAQAVHESHRGTAAADDIARFYVTNGWFGECEGDVPCYVSGQNELNGWYLRSYPRGRHADESNADIAQGLNGALDNLLQFPAVLAQFDPKTRCGELHASLDPLTAAVNASTSTRKAEALAALERYRRLCQ